jgi:hypothetical protein
MQTIRINNHEAEQYIKSVYGNNQSNLIDDFLLFVKTEIASNELLRGFDEVEKYKDGKTTLSDAKDFLSELKSDYQNN